MSSTWQLSSAPLQNRSARILAFNGSEGVMDGYTFDILFCVEDMQAKDAKSFMNDMFKAASHTLIGKRAQGDSFERHGMAKSISYLFCDNNECVFRLLLSPRSHALSLSCHSYIYLQMSLTQIISKLLQEENLVPKNDFDMKLQNSYPTRPYTCQYNESSEKFIKRHLERVGAYTYIRQENGKDVLVLADDKSTPEKLPIRDDLKWSEDNADETVLSFIRTLKATPTKVTLCDYNTENPDNLTQKSIEDADKLHGGGTFRLYGEDSFFLETDSATKEFIAEEADSAAQKLVANKLRMLKSKANYAHGESTIPWLQSGYSIHLDDEDFQLISIEHSYTYSRDNREERMIRYARKAGFIPTTTEGYRNSFTCHPLDVCAYAPPMTIMPPRISGFIAAKVDAAGDGQYAELDDHGRYKVKFFFPEKVIYMDADDPTEGNFSVPLRMIQSHTGKDSGIHFPLLKGAEILVGFSGGNPDRPIIMGALPNPDNPSVVSDTNQQENVIKSPGGSSITFVDTKGVREILMESHGASISICETTK